MIDHQHFICVFHWNICDPVFASPAGRQRSFSNAESSVVCLSSYVVCHLSLYYALVHPHLTYGILAWGNANINILNKTIKLQKRALRTIFNTRYNSHTDPLFKTSGILKLADIYTYNILVFMYDYSKSKLPRSFNSAFRYNREIQAIRLTRQCDLLHIAWCHSSYAKKCLCFHFRVYGTNGLIK